MRFYLALTLAVVIITSGHGLSRAQTAGADLTGEVRDSQRALLPQAHIRLTQLATGHTTTVTVIDGAYTITNLRPGIYNCVVEAPGFKQLLREGLQLATGERIRLDFVLEPGSLNESVLISSDATLLRTETGSLGQVISQRKIVDYRVCRLWNATTKPSW